MLGRNQTRILRADKKIPGSSTQQSCATIYLLSLKLFKEGEENRCVSKDIPDICIYQLLRTSRMFVHLYGFKYFSEIQIISIIFI